MTSSGQIDIRTYRSPLLRFNISVWKRSLSWLRETFFPAIPGTRQFQYRYRKQIAEETTKGLKLFRDLRALDSTTKRCLLFHVRTYEKQWAGMVVRRRYAATVGALVFLIGMAVTLIYSLPSMAVQAYLAVPPIIEQIGWASFMIHGLGTVIVEVSIVFIGIFAIPAIIQWYPRFILSLLLLVLMLALGIAFYLEISVGRSPWDVISPLFSPNQSIFLVMITSVFALILFLVFIHIVFKRQLRAFHPDAILVHTLLSILSTVEKHPRQWPQLSFRQQLIPMLEESAICIQHGLGRQFRSGDDIIGLWLQDTAARKAAALRELKKWVLVPQSNTRDQFIARIAACLSQVASGNWDALEQMEPGKISHLQVWRSYAVTALRALFTASLPLLLWWAFQQTSLALKGRPAEYVTVGIYLWAALTLIMACDPLLGLKATALKEVVQSLPGLGSFLGKDKSHRGL